MTRHPAHDIYTYLGAHPAEQGFTFRVWAPNARAVALAGDFNGWQPRPMTRLDTGVWETAAENAKVYDGKTEVTSGTLSTGMTAVVGNKSYTLVVTGDVNGDGKVNNVDAALIYAYHNKKLTKFSAA